MKAGRLIPSRSVRRWAWTALLGALLVLYPLSVFRAAYVSRESVSPTSMMWSCVWVGTGSIGVHARIARSDYPRSAFYPPVAWECGSAPPYSFRIPGWVEYQMHSEGAVRILHGWLDASMLRRGTATVGDVAYRLSVPLWMPLLVVALGTLFSWRGFFRDRRQARRGMCAGCGYFVGNLAKDVPCPECGRRRTEPNE